MTTLFPARSEVRLFSPAGAQVAIFDTWRSLQYQHKLNGSGFFTFIIDANDAKRALFEENGQFEVWRWIPGALDPYLEFEGLIENPDDSLFSNGNFQFTSIGSGYNTMLGRRIVAYTDATVFSQKTAVAAETAMKEYVNENCTTNADASREEGTQADAEIPGLTVQANTAQGATWSGERSGKGVLSTLQEIAIFAFNQNDNVDFQVVGTRASNLGPTTYEFRTFPSQLGDDRTTAGLDPATGKNGAGNDPHVFSPDNDNVKNMRYSQKIRGSGTAVYVWGNGSGALRTFGYAEDATKTGLARREVMRGGGSQDTDAERDALAAEWLEALTAQEIFNFAPSEVAASRYNIHWFFGDKVTAKLGDIERDKKITAVTITNSDKVETIQVEFTDVSL